MSQNNEPKESLYKYNGQYISTYNFNEKKYGNIQNVPINWKKTAPLLKGLLNSEKNIDLSKIVVYNEKTKKTKEYMEAKEKKRKKKEEDRMNSEISEFWRLITRVVCLDKDEGIMTPRSIGQITHQKNMILNHLNNRFIPKLKEALSNTPINDGIDQKDMNDLLTHIVFKGKAFYDAIVADPMFGLYLCDQYYPIYTWLNV